MDIKIVIPARYNSSRLPGKPLADICGKPMIVRVYERVREALPSTDICVAIDDERVQKVLEKELVPYVMTATDHQSGTDRIAEVCRYNNWDESTIVINVQGDEPLIPKALLQEFLSMIKSTKGFEMGTVCSPLTSIDEAENSNVVKVITNKSNEAIYFSRYPIPFKRDEKLAEIDISKFKKHIGIYAYTVGTLLELSKTEPTFIEEFEKLEQLRALWLKKKVNVLEIKEVTPHGVDTKEDLDEIRKTIYIKNKH